MTTTTDKPRRRRAPGGGRKPIGDKPFEAAIYIRLDAATRAYWRGDGERGSLSTAVRRLLTEVADGDAVVMRIDTAVHLAVAPWLAARLAEVEAQDLDETDLEDWLRGLLDALAEASHRRHDPPDDDRTR